MKQFMFYLGSFFLGEYCPCQHGMKGLCTRTRHHFGKHSNGLHGKWL